jgi:hypothetical protein
MTILIEDERKKTGNYFYKKVKQQAHFTQVL